jgi:hypothetical protein
MWLKTRDRREVLLVVQKLKVLCQLWPAWRYQNKNPPSQPGGFFCCGRYWKKDAGDLVRKKALQWLETRR